jgi:hypothetical protein
MSKGENIVKWIKGAKDKLVRSPRENGGGWDAQKDLHSRTQRPRRRGKPTKGWKEEAERDLPSAGSEKMERVGGR